jgi:hypothetical protein
MAALLPTLECVAAPIPAPAAPPTVAPVRVPQPPATKLKSKIPRYHARVCLFFIGLTSYEDASAKRIPIDTGGRKKAYGKSSYCAMLSAIENGTGRLELLLRKNSTSARDEIAEEYAFL